MITDFSGLKTFVRRKVNRPAPALTDDDLETFIQLVEAKVNRRLADRDMESVLEADLTSSTLTIPSDFLAVRSMRLIRGENTLERNRIIFEPLDVLESRADFSEVPCYYSKRADQFVFWPTPQEVNNVRVRITYKQRVPALTEAAPTNWLLNLHPDVYEMGTLCQAYEFIKDEQRAGFYEQRFLQGIEDINDHDMAEEDQPLEINPSTGVAA